MKELVDLKTPIVSDPQGFHGGGTSTVCVSHESLVLLKLIKNVIYNLKPFEIFAKHKSSYVTVDKIFKFVKNIPTLLIRYR